jgi:alpha-N-acetylglucosamine transferase
MLKAYSALISCPLAHISHMPHLGRSQNDSNETTVKTSDKTCMENYTTISILISSSKVLVNRLSQHKHCKNKLVTE